TEQEEKKPLLVEKSKATEALMVEIQGKRKSANQFKVVLQKEEAVSQKQADEADAIASSCEADLAKALPALESAMQALKSLKKSDIVEIKAMSNPPEGVRTVMEAICIIKKIKPKMVNDPATGKKTADYWPEAKKILGNFGFLPSLLKFDKDNIPEDTITALKVYIDDPGFTRERALQASAAAGGLCAWVRAMYTYHFVNKEVLPKKAALKEARAELATSMAALKEKRKAVAEIEAELAELEAKYTQACNERDQLSQEYEQCVQRLK
ncbi:dynein heavy chain, partial [Kipferlia bialata]